MSPPRPDELPARVGLGAVAAYFYLPVVVILGAILAFPQRPGLFSGAIAVAAAGLVLAIRHIEPPRRVAFAVLALLPAAALIAASTVRELGAPFAVADPSEARLPPAFGVALRLLFALALWPAWGASAAAIGERLARPLRRRDPARVGRVVRILAMAAAVGSTALLFLALHRSKRPAVDEWVASLPVVAQLDPLAGGPWHEGAAQRTQRAAPGRLKILRTEVAHHECGLSVTVDRPPPMPAQRRSAHGMGGGYEPCGALVVRGDETRGAWILGEEQPNALLATPMLGITAEVGGPAEIAPARLGLGPPRALVLLAVAGLAAGLLALRARPRSALPDRGRHCRDAMLSDDGVLRFGDETPDEEAPPGERPPPGPVTVASGQLAASFREHAGPRAAELFEGTVAENLLAAEVEGPATALVVTLLAAAPLAAALAVLG